MSAASLPALKTSDDEIVKKAVRNAAEQLGISLLQLFEITGVHRESLSGDPESLGAKEMELCLLVIGVANSLSSLVGGDRSQMKNWIRSPNQAFEASPLETMKTVEGLARTARYLEGMRSKI